MVSGFDRLNVNDFPSRRKKKTQANDVGRSAPLFPLLPPPHLVPDFPHSHKSRGVGQSTRREKEERGEMVDPFAHFDRVPFLAQGGSYRPSPTRRMILVCFSQAEKSNPRVSGLDAKPDAVMEAFALLSNGRVQVAPFDLQGCRLVLSSCGGANIPWLSVAYEAAWILLSHYKISTPGRTVLPPQRHVADKK